VSDFSIKFYKSLVTVSSIIVYAEWPIGHVLFVGTLTLVMTVIMFLQIVFPRPMRGRSAGETCESQPTVLEALNDNMRCNIWVCNDHLCVCNYHACIFNCKACVCNPNQIKSNWKDFYCNQLW